MRDLSLHILDLAQNSLRAGAKLISITVRLEAGGALFLLLEDDGAGMSAEALAQAESPFYTTRGTRRVGLGLSLMAECCRMSGGALSLQSSPGKGTRLSARLDTRRLDCPPLGSLWDTLAALIAANPDTPDFTLHCQSPRGETRFDTRSLRAALRGAPLCAPEIVSWMRTSIQAEIQPIFGGVIL